VFATGRTRLTQTTGRCRWSVLQADRRGPWRASVEHHHAAPGLPPSARPSPDFTNCADSHIRNRPCRLAWLCWTACSDSSAAHSAHVEYLTRLHSIGIGQAFSNHFAHEQIVFQAHSPRNGLFKRESDIVGTNAGRDRHKGLRTLLPLPCERPLSPLQPRPTRRS
jgi:hypothetical protein